MNVLLSSLLPSVQVFRFVFPRKSGLIRVIRGPTSLPLPFFEQKGTKLTKVGSSVGGTPTGAVETTALPGEFEEDALISPSLSLLPFVQVFRFVFPGNPCWSAVLLPFPILF